MQGRRWSTLLIYVMNSPSLQEFVIIRVLEEPWSTVTWRWGSILSKIASLWSALARSVSYQTLRRQDAAYEINKAQKACLCFWDYEVSEEDVFLPLNVKLPWSNTRSLWSAKQKCVTSYTTYSKFLADNAIPIDLCSSVLHQSLSAKAWRALQNRPQWYSHS
jgi:hypothetical protein